MIKAIIFDLGGTLIQLTRNPEEVIYEGAEAMASWFLKKRRIKVDAEALIDAFTAELAAADRMANETQTEVLAQDSLHTALNKIEASSSTKAFIEGAVKVYFGPIEDAWQPFPDAINTLKRLKTQAYKLGLYSNANDDKHVQRLINRNYLRPHLSPTFSSAAWGWRKPRPEPFELIAKRWGLPVEQIVVVGDTLEADILGARNAGMASILAKMNEAPSNAAHVHLRATAAIERLADLPEILQQL